MFDLFKVKHQLYASKHLSKNISLMVFFSFTFIITSISWLVPIDAQEFNFLYKFGSEGSEDGQFGHPFSLKLHDNQIYVADHDNHRIQVFDSTGEFLYKFGSEGSEDGQFNGPFDLSFDDSENMYVADIYNHRIQVFDSTGEFLYKFGSKGSEDGQLKHPHSVLK